MQQAGIVTLQPGIESLSSPVLRRMRKGVKAIQNVNLLRWSRYYGMTTSWNLLWGFPGEQAAEYEKQAALMRRLVHLQAPTACGPVWLERFSPLFRERDSFPLERLSAERSYRYVYPTDVYLERLAFFFDYELRDTLPIDSFESVAAATRHWQKRAAETPGPALWFFRAPGYLEIDDQREADQRYLHRFEGELADLYFALSDRPHRPDAVKAQLGLEQPLSEIIEALDEFCRRGLMMEDEGSYLALALPAGGMR